MAVVASIFYPGFDYPNFFYNEGERMKNIDSRNKISSNSFIHKDSHYWQKLCNWFFCKIRWVLKLVIIVLLVIT